MASFLSVRQPRWVAYAVLALVGSLVGAVFAQNQQNAWPGDAPRPGQNPGETLLPLKSFFLTPPYLDTQFHSRWWDFGGSTIVEVNRHVRLTQDLQSQSGWIFSRAPLTSQSWQLEFEFRVGGKGTGLGGDGFALWYVEEKGAGRVFGMKDYFTGLGIFFDTYPNDHNRRGSFPYVMGMLGDGKTPYNKDVDGKDTEIAGCHSDFRNKEIPTRGRLRYNRGKTELVLELAVRQENVYEQCFLVQGVNLPLVGYVGFSAHTGEVTDNHDIIALTAFGLLDTNSKSNSPDGSALPYSAVPAAPIARGPNRRSGPSSSSGGGWWKVLLALVLIGGAVAGIVAYFQRARGKSAKLF